MVKLFLICMKVIRGMRIIHFIVLMMLGIMVGLVSCQRTSGSGKTNSQVLEEQDEAKGTPVIKFTIDSHDFGDISPGEKVSYTFTFTNEGNANLVIISAAASCGCTVPKWNKDPLPPGKEGHIEVVFDSSGRSGKQIKNVTIRSNGDPAVKVLQIQANILEPNN
jgi:hypothetical protein